MKLVMCSVYDVKAGVFSQPQYFRSNAEAIRAFADAVNKEGTQFNAHASDYVFFKIGEFDDSNGSVQPFDAMPLINGPEALSKS